jgi:hypothetical protein
MSDENELTPELEAALRDIPAADPALRDQHIAAALGDLAPVATTKRRNLFAAAAAVLVLAGAGFAVSRNSDDTPPALAADTTATSLPKASGKCARSGGSWGDVGGTEIITLRGMPYEVVLRDDAIDLFLEVEPCTQIGYLDYLEAMQLRDKEDAMPSVVPCTQKALVQFADNAGGPEYRLALLETADGVSLFFEDRCNEPLGSIALTVSGD